MTNEVLPQHASKVSLGKIVISQAKYAKDLPKKFNMLDFKLLSTPMATNEKLYKHDGKENIDGSTKRSPIGSLIYLTNTQLDIVHSVNIVSDS